jgi:hypothetical protein
MDDPLFLLMQGIWLLAAGMYPLGFLFGACSACCCPDECSKCTHYHHLPVDPPGFIPLETSRCREKFDLVTMTAECDTCSGSRTLADVYPDEDQLRATPSGDVFLTDVIQCDGFTTRLTANDIRFFYALPVFNDCGCRACRFLMRIRLRLTNELSGFDFSTTVFEIQGLFDRCQQTEADITSFDDLNPETAAWTDGFPKELINGFLQSIADNPAWDCDVAEHLFADNVFFKMKLELDMPCECGACCQNGECRENIAESYCEDIFDAFNEPDAGGGTWQGVGTDCDPNPCPQPGACCDGGECSETLEADCGGVFQGEGTSCDPNPC